MHAQHITTDRPAHLDGSGGGVGGLHSKHARRRSQGAVGSTAPIMPAHHTAQQHRQHMHASPMHSASMRMAPTRLYALAARTCSQVP